MSYDCSFRAHLEPPPAFGAKESLASIAKTFFWFGCEYQNFKRDVARAKSIYLVMFPPLWGFGATVLIWKPQSDPEKAILEQEEDRMRLFREHERKWGYRCLFAFVIFLVLAAIIVVTLSTTIGSR